MLAIGLAASLSVSGTYALLNSETSNAGSTTANGTLTFGNQVNSGSVCYTYGAGSSVNQNDACDALVTSATQYYPGDSVAATVTISNNGSLPLSKLVAFMPSCTAQPTPGAGANAGGGNPCSTGVSTGPQLTIQETDSGGAPTYCWYPIAASGTCSNPASPTLAAMAVAKGNLSSAINMGSGPSAGQSRYFKVTVYQQSTAASTLQGEAAVFSITWWGQS